MSGEWVAEELRQLKLADARLTARAKQLIASFSVQPAQSIPEACENWAATKAAYRFLENQRVDEGQLWAAHYQATRARTAGHARILAIQDTTELNYTGKAVAAALGHLANQHTRGLLLHSVLAVSTAGVPLGLVDQHSWSRELSTKGKAQQRRQ